MNNKYVVRVEHPLVRPGLSIETEASERYLARVVATLMEQVREINGGPPLREAVRNLYYAGNWSCDRNVPETALWEAVRDAAGFTPGDTKRIIPEEAA